MKHASIILCVLAAGVMPVANAQSAGDTPARAFEIKVEGAVAPSGLHQLTYPYSAGVKSRAGSCDLSVKVDDQGNIGAVSVEACSSDDFATEASKLVGVDETVEVASVHPLRIEWSMED
ncbi:hypothetical protein [Hirschia baltica]|uniref:TonB C-terminal domain-containing protein n=1 Tax=Hirschia baltica (strain ATCC 49814 / DSM 5838 / IFAM 1418) TaxID=582402 RepID=C6XN76_HIRBI|nr:hypothetical protein [Hirschia baltica]ACT58246.1 hypothetical protein Hbal_0544 [Hirschia baltica ATCC 49814]